jgi:hypothetical protein
MTRILGMSPHLKHDGADRMSRPATVVGIALVKRALMNTDGARRWFNPRLDQAEPVP